MNLATAGRTPREEEDACPPPLRISSFLPETNSTTDLKAGQRKELPTLGGS